MLILYGNKLSEDNLKLIQSHLAGNGIASRYIRRASKYGVMDVVRDGDGGEWPDVIVLGDYEMPSGNYTAEEYVYMRYSRDIKVIPVLGGKKRGTDYMRILLENGIYNAIFIGDTTPRNIEHLIMKGRTYKTARAYYEI